MIKTIEPNVGETIEPNASEKVEQKTSKTIKVVKEKYFLTYLNNLTTPLLTTMFGRNTPKQISISAMYQLADTNHTRIEYISLSATATGSNVLAIGSARLRNKFIVVSNQARTSIDRWDTVNGTSPLGVGKVVTKLVLVSGGTHTTKFELTNREPSEDHDHILTGPG